MPTQEAGKPYSTLALRSPEELMFGRVPKPVSCGYGLQLGAGAVYPELNFTLPTMLIEEESWSSIVNQYDELGEMIRRTAKRLHLPGLMIEFELLPPMTERPEWGAEITRVLDSHLKKAHEVDGLPCALRVTPTDIRDAIRPPLLRTGTEWETLRASFEACAEAGAHVLSIESVGGKELNDEAMMYGDVEGVMFALGVLAPRDMQFLWKEIVSICTAHGVVPGGDSACGFANTAMQLSSQGMLPEVFAAMVRGASAVRSLVAYECGAFGPSKDCAYEGPILKAITGAPIAMEGKSASCAHFSPVGNVAAAMCDLWSNESVQNVRLLSGPAPEAFLELLTYDCRLFNAALSTGSERIYQRMLVESDIHLSAQALVLSPESTIRIASAIVRERTHYRQTIAAASEALHVIRDAVRNKTLALAPKEHQWLDKIESALVALPAGEGGIMDSMIDRYGHLFTPSSYGL
jgi:methanol--5-hydroxybenzimidazolylcobamide Co-methyltransferase